MEQPRRIRKAARLVLPAVAVALIAGCMHTPPPVGSASIITDDGVRLHVLEAGPPVPAPALPVIAFVPGWSMPASIWCGQLEALGARHRVAALDPRGQGESDVPQNGYDIDRRADDIAAFVARYPKVVLVGWSLGALEALHYLHRHGDARLAALVLVDSSVGEEPAPPPGTAFIDALRADREAVITDFVRGIFRSPRPGLQLEQLKNAALRMPLEESITLFPRRLPREHWRDLARGFGKPLLYAVTPNFAEQADNLRRNRPGTRVEIFEDAGHALFVDEPERFNALLTEFLHEAGVR